MGIQLVIVDSIEYRWLLSKITQYHDRNFNEDR